MPSRAEFQELYNKCDWTWKSNYNGASGYLVTGPNGRTIFLPASGRNNDGFIYYDGSCGYYWSSSLYEDYIGDANYLFFENSRFGSDYSYNRYLGLTVRPVAEK